MAAGCIEGSNMVSYAKLVRVDVREANKMCRFLEDVQYIYPSRSSKGIWRTHTSKTRTY